MGNTIHILYFPAAEIKKDFWSKLSALSRAFFRPRLKRVEPSDAHYLLIVFSLNVQKIRICILKTSLHANHNTKISYIINRHFLKSCQYFFDFQINSGKLSPLKVLIIIEGH